MSRRIIGVAAAVLLGAVGTFVLVAYVKSAENRALAGERIVEVLVVQEAVALGTPADDLAGKVDTERVPVKVAARGGVDDLASLDGKVAAVDLVAGEQLVTSRFTEPEVLETRTGVEVPDDLQQVTVSLEPQRAVGGQLDPGDSVGVFASFTDAPDDDDEDESNETTHLTLHKVLVTNIQGDPRPAPEEPEPAGGDDDGESPAARDEPGREPAPGGNLLVTLAVDAGQAEKVVFAAEHGTIWLSAEPEEASEKGTRVQTKETIYE